MIDSVYIENFRRIEKAYLPLRDGITCLTGKNGTGKSTIIEAILFNLYGKIKAGTTKESIPRSNKKQSDVTYTSVDFTLNGMHYRCRRYMSDKLNVIGTLYSYTDAEYERLLQQDDQRHLDKNLGTMVATSTTGVTNAITQLFGLGYEGYRASLVATQKELDALASLTKENKKKFFLDLLNYSLLDSVKPEISREIRDRQKMREVMDRQSIDQKEAERSLKNAKDALKDIMGRVEKGNDYLRREQEAYSSITKRYDDIRKRFEGIKKDKEDYERFLRESEAAKTKIAQLESKIAANKETSKGYDDTSSVSEKIAAITSKLDKNSTYQRYLREHDRMLETVTAKEESIKAISAEISSLESKRDKEPDLESAEEAVKALQEESTRRVTNRQSLEASAKSVENLIEVSESGEETRCPTCGSIVSSKEGRDHLSSEKKRLGDEIGKLDEEIDETNKMLLAAKTNLDKTKSMIRDWNADAQKIASLRKEKELLESGIDDDREQLSIRKAYISEHECDSLERDEQTKLENDLVPLRELKEREAAMREAFYAVKEDTIKLENARKEESERSKSISALSSSLSLSEDIVREYESISKEKEKSESTISMYQDRLSELKREQGIGETNVKMWSDRVDESKAQQKDLEKISSEIESWIGAKSVIEYMRENLPAKITPKLSDTASKLLETTTGGAYSMVEIDEDYNVSVYAENDIRNLDQMSGGEQDVISLCIRIAIAEMILESTNNSQQTLILDEIFGALDDSRKQQACDTLRNLSDTLPRILCITHVDEIRDMADWSFVVEKDDNGVSTIRELKAVGDSFEE